MPTYTPEEIEERFAQLPESLKEQMMSVENSERIFEVGKKFGMTIEQIGFLAEESGYVVLGLTHPKDFVVKLKDHLRVDEEKAKIIAKEINHHVFFPLREILKTTHQFELTQEQIQEPPPPIPSIPHTQPLIPKSSPAIQSEARHIEWPTPQSEIRHAVRPIPPTPPTTPAPVINKPTTPPVSPVPLASPVPSVSKPTPPPTPISDIKSSIVSTPIKPPIPPPSIPHPMIVPPTRSILPEKPPITLISPIPVPIPQTTPQIPRERSGDILISNPKTTTPIPLPPPRPLTSGEIRPIVRPDIILTPIKPPELVNPSSISHPLPPIGSQTSPLSNHLDIPTIEEKKSESLIPPAKKNETHSIGQPTTPAVLKTVEDIKPKEPGITPTPIQIPLPPSQMMQKNLLEEVNRPKTAIQSEVERMKESLFAPPSAPLNPPLVSQKPQTQTPIHPPTPPEADKQRPTSNPELLQKTPASYSNHDPYREPLE